MVTEVPDDDFGTVRMQNVVPRMTNNPGRIRWAAKDLGADTDAILSELGYSPEEIAAHRAKGIV